MKVIRNKLFRLALYILGFLCVLSAGTFTAAAVFRCAYFANVKNMDTIYEESNSLKEGILGDLNTVQRNARAERFVQNLNISDKELEIVNYSDICDEMCSGDKKNLGKMYEKVTVKDLLGNTATKTMADYTSRSGGDIESLYTAYDNMKFPEEKKYIRLTWGEYTEIVRNNCLKYSSSKYWDWENDENIPDEEREMLRMVFEENRDCGIEDGDYFTVIDNNLYMFQRDYGLVYYSAYGSAQIPNDIPMSDYIYFPYSKEVENLHNQKEFERYILSGYIYRTAAEAVYASLDDNERTELKENSNVNDYYIFGSNSAYSLDGENVSRVWIYDSERLGDIDDHTSNSIDISYGYLCKVYEENADVFIKYDAESKEITQWYKDPRGNKVSFEYLSKNDIDNLIRDTNDNFVLSINISDIDCYHTWIKNAYNFSRFFPNSEVMALLSFIVFLVCVVLLIWGEPAKLYKVDNIPYVIWLMFYGTVIACVCAPVAGMEYSYSIASALNNDRVGFLSVVAFVLLLVYLSTAAVIMNLVRRIKCNKFLDGFLIIKAARWIKRKLNKLLSRFPGNMKLVAFIGAYCILMLFVLIFLYANSYNGVGAPAVLIMVVATAVFVFVIFKYMTDLKKLLETSKRIEAGELNAKVNTNDLSFNAKEMGESLNNLGGGLSKAVESSLRDERTKAELITNVSHDIKTPLTSIINYVDLLKKEEINNDKAVEYINVLDQKSQRLKQLILDLIEASKTSTGNIELECMNMNLVELLNQGLGEYEDKLDEAGLEVVKNFKLDSAVINADGRRVFRIIDNILNNVVKYAQKGTRVYMDLDADDNGMVKFGMKNISRESLNISAEELTERFVRGDRSRNTEGSGLGLSIAKNLTELQNGKFDISIDGDLFKVGVSFPLVKPVVNAQAEKPVGESVVEHVAEPVAEPVEDSSEEPAVESTGVNLEKAENLIG